jgi:hypothetical protein
MSTRVRVPLAIVSALSMLALSTGTAQAADDPVQTVTDCLTGLTAAACTTTPLESLAPGGTSDPGAGPGTGATPAAGAGTGSGAADSAPVARQGVPTCDDLAGDLGLPDCPGLPGGDGTGVGPAAGGDDAAGAGTPDGTGGTATPLCALVSQVPPIPGLPDLAAVTCVQLPAVLCPLLPDNPELAAVVGLVCPRPLAQAGTPTTLAPAALPVTAPASYENCDAARAAGAAPIAQGQPGYRPELDRDSDGVACDDGQEIGAPAAVAGPALTPSGRLAYTGVTPLPLLLAGAALLLLGSGFLLAGRRRA